MENKHMVIGDPCICGSNKTVYCEMDGREWQGLGYVEYERCDACGRMYYITYELYPEDDPTRHLLKGPGFDWLEPIDITVKLSPYQFRRLLELAHLGILHEEVGKQRTKEWLTA